MNPNPAPSVPPTGPANEMASRVGLPRRASASDIPFALTRGITSSGGAHVCPTCGFPGHSASRCFNGISIRDHQSDSLSSDSDASDCDEEDKVAPVVAPAAQADDLRSRSRARRRDRREKRRRDRRRRRQSEVSPDAEPDDGTGLTDAVVGWDAAERARLVTALACPPPLQGNPKHSDGHRSLNRNRNRSRSRSPLRSRLPE
jgi:hypothetical protein